MGKNRMEGFQREEKRIILILDKVVGRKSVKRMLNGRARRVEKKLMEDSCSALAWESVPLEAYEARLPEAILSSWVFAVRAEANSGAERHPNSHQFMMSYEGSGDLQVQVEEEWISNPLVSSPREGVENRWVAVPPNVWHRAIAHGENWIVVSFHTASADSLIEERPDFDDEKGFFRRHYLDGEEKAKL